MQFDSYSLDLKNIRQLTKEETLECLKQTKVGNLEAREKVIKHNLRLVLSRAHQYNVGNYDINDLFSVGTIGLIKAVDSFDITRGPGFTKYAVKCIDNELFMFFRKNNKFLKEESINSTPLYYDTDGNELKLENTLRDERVDFVSDYERYDRIMRIRNEVELLKDKDKEIIKLYFGFYDKQYTQKEISSIIGISQSHISRIINRICLSFKDKVIRKRIVEPEDFDYYKTSILLDEDKPKELLKRND